MKIKTIKSFVLKNKLSKELGYSQQYYQNRTAHLVRVETDEGIVGWGECFGPGGYGPGGTEYLKPVVSQSSKLTLPSHSYRQLQEEVPQDRTVDAGQG